MGINALSIAHHFLKERVRPGQTVIDATAGNGGDALYLCQLMQGEGKLLAFDIQQEAVERTKERLNENGYGNIAEVICRGHEHMTEYAAAESVDGIVFNFGWLPGGDHDIFTKKESSIAAIKAGLELLKPGGFMSLCVYYGRNNGYTERDAILELMEQVDSRKFTVLQIGFPNRRNDPPFPIFIIKDNP